jgi:hypothetical protein
MISMEKCNKFNIIIRNYKEKCFIFIGSTVCTIKIKKITETMKKKCFANKPTTTKKRLH